MTMTPSNSNCMAISSNRRRCRHYYVLQNCLLMLLLLFLVPCNGYLSKSLQLLSSRGNLFSMSSRMTTSTRPTTLLLKAIPLVDQWRLLNDGRLVGRVTNHPVIDNGDIITTSPLANPTQAAPNTFVTTSSGSKYKLGIPTKQQQQRLENQNQRNGKSQPNDSPRPSLIMFRMNNNNENNNNVNNNNAVENTPPPSKPRPSLSLPRRNIEQQEPSQEEIRQARLKYGLTNFVVGDYNMINNNNNQYLLADRPTRSTSGKSQIWKAYQSNNGIVPTIDNPFTIKISPNLEAVSREAENYRRIRRLFNDASSFVQMYKFLPTAGANPKFSKQCALVLERGDLDLKTYVNSKNGPLSGRPLRDAASAAVACLQSVHGANLVWTDLKTENFVVMLNNNNNIAVKGIDLESAMPRRDNPVDYSPEACPPEFAKAFLAGEGPYFVLDYSYDIWSLGMFLLEIATGRGPFDGKSPAQITTMLRDFIQDDDDNNNELTFFWDQVQDVTDNKLRDLIVNCLTVDPNRRPGLTQIMLHPYFVTTGLGPFSF